MEARGRSNDWRDLWSATIAAPNNHAMLRSRPFPNLDSPSRIGRTVAVAPASTSSKDSPAVVTRYADNMQALKVQVKNGRLVVDEPTDLPEGAEVEVVVIDDKLTTEERAELHASLDRALDDSEEGRCMDAGEYLKQYRAGRADRPAR